MATCESPEGAAVPARARCAALASLFGAVALAACWVALRPADYADAAARGRAALERGRPLQALEAVAGVDGPGRGAGEALTVAGQAFIRLNQRDDARRALERALELEPERPLALKLLAAVSIASGDTNRALDLLARAARADPADPRPPAVAGKLYFSRKQYAESIAAFEEALARDRSDRGARLGLIVVLLDRGQNERAEPWVEEALRDEPDDPKVLGLAAAQSFASGRTGEADRLASRALEHDPDNFEGRLTRAKVALRAGRPEAALADAERAVAADPNDVAALHLLSRVEFRLGLTDRATATAVRRDRVQARRESISVLAAMVAERPGEPALLCRLGRLASEAGLTVLAAESYRSALALDPRSRPARDGLAALGSAPVRFRGRATP